MWFGYDTPRPMGDDVNGGRYAAPAWADFYRNGWKGRTASWKPPTGLVAVEIDPETGLVASDWCPTQRREYFRAGTEPTEQCEGHHDHDEDFIADVIEQLQDKDWKPLTRTLRRLLERR